MAVEFKRTFFWFAVAALFIVLLNFLGHILMPFVLGALIAYLTNPLVLKMTSKGIPRFIAALLTIIGFFVLLGVLVMASLPFLISEIRNVIIELPGHIENLIQAITSYTPLTESFDNLKEETNLQNLIKDGAGPALDFTHNIVKQLWAGGQSVLNSIYVIIVSPVVAFFVLTNWAYLTSQSKDLIPRRNKNKVEALLDEMNQKIAGFIRGQLLVMIVLGAFYAVALTALGLKYGFIIGLLAGFLNIIPLAGSTAGLIIASIAAWLQTADWQFTLLIAAIFMAGQLLEGYFLTPKLVGDQVGLHPVIVFFALLTGGSLFGILGILLAIPVAAIISVLLGFFIKEYKQSTLYKDKNKTKEKNHDS